MFYDGAIISNSVTVLALITIFASYKNIQCAIAVAVSLLSAKYLTAIGADELHVHALFICAAISITSFNGYKFTALDIRQNEINYAVSFLYVVRMIVGILFIIGLYGAEVMWLLSIFFLIVQLIVILGGCIDGISNRISDILCALRLASNKRIFTLSGSNHQGDASKNN